MFGEKRCTLAKELCACGLFCGILRFDRVWFQPSEYPVRTCSCGLTEVAGLIARCAVEAAGDVLVSDCRPEGLSRIAPRIPFIHDPVLSGSGALLPQHATSPVLRGSERQKMDTWNSGVPASTGG
ncbi:hypothetical protein BaRGS_00036749 [Batillaria attramentaria]|uniref:Uncharacterized protein n=1 Tax=Batillaria attramentaria TaxID=370345 RepID=A0ABD0JAM8_9CAEN